MKRSGFKNKANKPLKRSGFKRATVGGLKGLKRTTAPRRPKPVTVSSLKKKLWVLCREITRKRWGNTCFTCGKSGLTGSSWQTGHFIPSSICSVALRYDLDNLRIQCYNCNINKSGNWVAFEQYLGKQKAESLKKKNRLSTGKQYDSLWYLAKIEEYAKQR